MEGLWHAHFSSGPARGDGIAVLRDGQILGGDASHIYTGSYQTDGSQVYLSVRVSRWLESDAAVESSPPVTFVLSGSVAGNSANVSGHPDDRRDVTVAVELRRAA